MLTLKMIKPGKKLSVIIAVAFAKDVLHIYEAEYPEDKCPRKEIEAAELYLASNATSNAASAAASAASNAAAADAADASYAAFYAASAAYSNVRNAAFYAASYAASAAYSNVRNAASYAAKAKQVNEAEYTHEMLLTMLPQILQFKIENKESFGDLDSVWEYLSDEDREVAVYHLDYLK